jgi:hypothetical protein
MIRNSNATIEILADKRRGAMQLYPARVEGQVVRVEFWKHGGF